MKLAIASGVMAAAGVPVRASSQSEVPMRQLGRTGEKVSCIGLGGSHIGKVEDEQESIRIMRSAIDRGLTFMEAPASMDSMGLSDKTLHEIEYFFKSYNKLAGKKFKIVKQSGRSKAMAIVKKAAKKYVSNSLSS